MEASWASLVRRRRPRMRRQRAASPTPTSPALNARRAAATLGGVHPAVASLAGVLTPLVGLLPPPVDFLRRSRGRN
uniref:Uncharacterized protein n=1 Tax=Arundo donax TaxID=35708 RepID=A0A0A8Y1H0_ARUDO